MHCSTSLKTLAQMNVPAGRQDDKYHWLILFIAMQCYIAGQPISVNLVGLELSKNTFNVSL